MTTTALILVVISAVLHAGWNFSSKRREPSLPFFFIAALSAAAIMLPYLLWQRSQLRLVPHTVWLLIPATGIAQGVYFWGLAGAYRYGDISLAYPLARALPVLFIAALSFLLGRGDQIGRAGLLGMVLIAGGCIILPLPTLRRLRPSAYYNTVTLMALAAALGTTAYTLIDDHALHILRNTPRIALSDIEVTLLFISIQAISTAIILGLISLLYGPDRHRLQRLVQQRALLLSGVVTGLVIMLAYGLILAAMAYVENVSYVAAFRQLSIPIGAVLGLTVLGEARYRPKLAGIAIVTIGLMLVAVG